MTVEEFTRRLEMEFEDLEPGTLIPEMNYRDIPEFSSMHALILIALIDSEYDVLLNGEDLKSVNTISELFYLIQTKK
jgi:acyl carrier protein